MAIASATSLSSGQLAVYNLRDDFRTDANCVVASPPNFWVHAQTLPFSESPLCLPYATGSGWQPDSFEAYPSVSLQDDIVSMHAGPFGDAISLRLSPGFPSTIEPVRARVYGRFTKYWDQPTDADLSIVRGIAENGPVLLRDTLWSDVMSGPQGTTFDFDVQCVLVSSSFQLGARVGRGADGSREWERAYVELTIEVWTGIADFNADGLLDLSDISAFITAFLTDDLAADLNADGILDLTDIVQLSNQFAP